MSQNKPLETPTKLGAGAMLQRAREKSGASLQDISSQTLIPLARLAALECEDLERVGGNAYVLGYARNAAEAIGTDPEPIVVAFSALLNVSVINKAHVDEPIAAVDQSLPRKIKKLMFFVGGALIVVLLILVFLLTGNHDPIAIKSGAVEPITAFSSSAIEGIDSSVDASEENSLMAAGLSDQLDTRPSLETTLTDEDLSISDPEDSNLEASEQELPSESNLPESIIADSDFSENDDIQASGEMATEKSLSLFFTDECWVQVTDSTGKRLTAKVANSGDHIQVSGQSPFDVMLGNATAVLIELNGESVDVSPKPGKRTLRLSVGG